MNLPGPRRGDGHGSLTNRRRFLFRVTTVAVIVSDMGMAHMPMRMAVMAVACGRTVIMRKVDQATLSYEHRSQEQDPYALSLIQSHAEAAPKR